MALIIKETVTLEDSGLQINEFVVTANNGRYEFTSNGKCDFHVQAKPYLTTATSFSRKKNYLKIAGFPVLGKFVFSYDYGIDDTNQLYWCETKIAELLLKAFPAWSMDNITITSKLPEGGE